MGVRWPQDGTSAPLLPHFQSRKRSRTSTDDNDDGHTDAQASPSTIPAAQAVFRSQERPQQRLIISAVAQMLKTCAHQGDLYPTLHGPNAQDPVLNPATAPLVSLSWYIRRILHYLGRWHRNAALAMPPCQRLQTSSTHIGMDQNGEAVGAPFTVPDSNVLLTALVYISRVSQSGRLVLTSRSVHRVLLVAVMLAHRYLEDSPADCQWFAQVGGVSKEELKRLETLFLAAIEWRLYVSHAHTDRVQFDISMQIAAAVLHRSAVMQAVPSFHAATTPPLSISRDPHPSLECVNGRTGGMRKRTRLCA
jgi:hypothetical protein